MEYRTVVNIFFRKFVDIVLLISNTILGR